MADSSQYVDETIEVLHALELGRSNGLSPYLFQQAMEALGPGHPQICGPLKKGLISPDDENVRLRVLEMIARTGPGWADLYGVQMADEIVLSIADSNVRCAANACHAVQCWEPGGAVSTALLLWGKRHLPGLWDVADVQAVQLPTVKDMIQELPSYAERLNDRRELPNSSPSLENNIRLWGKFKGTLMSVFNKN